MNTDPSRLLSDLLAKLHPHADFLRQARKDFSLHSIEYKRPHDLVSHVDRESEQRLKEICEDLLPGADFLLEESGEHKGTNDYRWIIDPLDGTTNFIHDVPAWCVSIALQEQGETIMGVVYDVPRGEVFTAIRGQGAHLNGKSIEVSPVRDLEGALLATGFPHTDADSLSDYLAVLQSFLQRSHGIRRFGAAAIDLCWVACGRLEGFYEMGLQAWDVAAGALIIQEAGGSVSDFEGTANFVFGRQIVGANAHLLEQMLPVLGERL